MNNILLISFAEFQLPEWLTFGNAVSTLITLIGLIAAIIKLRNSQANNKATFGALAKTLEANMALLTDVNNTAITISNSVTTLLTTFDKVIEALAAQNKATNNIAAFVFECFSLSNLSDENKLKLKISYDQLFHKSDAEIIEELRTSKIAIENSLIDKDKTITELTSKISELSKKLETAQATMRKSRRISS